jgi:hypothetical protein
MRLSIVRILLVTLLLPVACCAMAAPQDQTGGGRNAAGPVSLDLWGANWRRQDHEPEYSDAPITFSISPQADRLGVATTGLGIVLPVRLTNSTDHNVSANIAHEWHGGLWPGTSLYASVTPAQSDKIEPFVPVYLTGEDRNDSGVASLDPGQWRWLMLRLDWPGTGSVRTQPLVAASGGLYKVRLLLVVSMDGKMRYVVSPVSTVRVPAPIPELATLEERLRPVFQQVKPETRIDLRDGLLIIHYRSEQYACHLTNDHGNISEEDPANFPNDFDEFLLYVDVERDLMHHRIEIPTEKQETFGTTFHGRYNLRVLGGGGPESRELSMRTEAWVYAAYDKLREAGLVPEWRQTCMGACGQMSRFEFAWHIAQLLMHKTDKAVVPVIAAPRGPDAAAKPEADLLASPEVKKALDILEDEFQPELAALGALPAGAEPVAHQTGWQPRYENLSLRFSYGKGLDPALVAKVKQVLSDYATEVRNAGSASHSVKP